MILSLFNINRYVLINLIYEKLGLLHDMIMDSHNIIASKITKLLQYTHKQTTTASTAWWGLLSDNKIN